MRRIIFQSGMTLVELLVASSLALVVTAGIYTINVAINNSSQGDAEKYLLRSDTQAVLNHILNNASLGYGSARTNGSGNLNDEAILWGGQLANGDPNSFCIHQCGTTSNCGNPTPPAGQNMYGFPAASQSAADIWMCYTLSGNTINWCAETYDGGVGDPRGATGCGDPAKVLVAGTSVTYLGSANSWTFSYNTPPGGNGPLQFSVTIDNCLNNTASTCKGLPGTGHGVSSDLENNPEVELSGTVVPLQSSS